MADTSFMQKKFTIDQLVSHYLEDIKKLKSQVLNPSDETALQTYIQATNTFKRVSPKDIVQFALSYGKNTSGKSAQMANAFPIILGNRITQPSKLHVAYLHLLLEYATAFKSDRSNIKEWTVRFLLNSAFSPLLTLFERELNGMIAQTERKIVQFQVQVK